MSSSEAGHPVDAWAASGAMALTGAADGPPLVGPGDPAGVVTRALATLGSATLGRTGRAPRLPDARLLGERAAIAGLRRQAPMSCGGAFRAVPARGGHVGLSLARLSDLELLPALLESDRLSSRIDALVGEGERAPDWVWQTVAEWAAGATVDEVVTRAELLGLPVAGVSEHPTPPSADADWHDGIRIRAHGTERERASAPLVVDLTSLWAGPLCAHLLGLSGCRVVKVESVRRPDGARRGPARFFDLLHGGHQAVALDFASAEGRGQLAELVRRADVVLEGSRPRALQQLGIDARQVVAEGTTWLSITARGRESDTVGFGDDVAVAAGLFVRDADGTPSPCGDALADPLAGVVAAAAVAEALAGHTARMIEVSMWHVARAALLGAPTPSPHAVVRRTDGWWVEHDAGVARVVDPWARPPGEPAAPSGADNATVLR